jgi:hypothetical protein
VAVPTGPRESNTGKGLDRGLGRKCPTDFQYVSGWPPKPVGSTGTRACGAPPRIGAGEVNRLPTCGTDRRAVSCSAIPWSCRPLPSAWRAAPGFPCARRFPATSAAAGHDDARQPQEIQRQLPHSAIARARASQPRVPEIIAYCTIYFELLYGRHAQRRGICQGGEGGSHGRWMVPTCLGD